MSRRLLSDVEAVVQASSDSKSIQEIDKLYDKISSSLKEFAKLETASEESLAEDYRRLMDAKDRLVAFALNQNIQGLKDVKNILSFWYKITITEQTEDDLSSTDHLVIPVYKFLSEAKSLLAESDEFVGVT